MPSITEPPTLAETQAAWYARDAGLSQAQRDARRADYEHAANVERQIELAKQAPGVANAWQLTRLGMPATPLHPSTLEPVGEAISDPLATLDWWTQHPAHAVGISLGAHRGGTMALVAVAMATVQGWRDWCSANAVTERLRPWEGDPGRGQMERVGKPLGGPSFVLWQAPAAPPIRSYAFKGTRQMNEAAEAVTRANRGEDRGGWLCWTVGPKDQQLPVLKHHQLAAGLVVMGSDEVLPLSARTPQRWTLRQSGKFREPDGVHDCPGWLLEVFDATWTKVG